MQKPPPDPELNEEQRSLVEKLTESQLAEIDRALLQNVSSRWQKLAKIVGVTMSALENRVPGIPDIFYAERLREFIRSGEIEAEGHIQSMRYCELRTRQWLNERT